MKAIVTLALISAAFAASAAPAAAETSAFEPTEPLRNPFWPVDFDYTAEDLEPIRTNAVVEVKSAFEDEGAANAERVKAAAQLAKSSMAISSHTWAEATKALHFNGKTSVLNPETGQMRTAYFINGNTYGIGDFISANHNGRRFTWRIRQRTDMETLKLEQIRVVNLPDGQNDKKEGNGK